MIPYHTLAKSSVSCQFCHVKCCKKKKKCEVGICTICPRDSSTFNYTDFILIKLGHTVI